MGILEEITHTHTHIYTQWTMTSRASDDVLPTGGRIFTSIPDVFFIPEFVFGGLVWTLLASNHVSPENPLGWVMFVSIFCFIMTTVWLFCFLCGCNQSRIWRSLDVGYHFVAAVLYLSASVILAFITLMFRVQNVSSSFPTLVSKFYHINIAAVVMSFMATLFYFVHTIFSAIRWK